VVAFALVDQADDTVAREGAGDGELEVRQGDGGRRRRSLGAVAGSPATAIGMLGDTFSSLMSTSR